MSVGAHAFSRSLTYHQQLSPTLREYQPLLLGDAVLSVLYFPGAQFSQGFVTNIGLDLNVEQAFAIQSRTPDKARTTRRRSTTSTAACACACRSNR